LIVGVNVNLRTAETLEFESYLLRQSASYWWDS